MRRAKNGLHCVGRSMCVYYFLHALNILDAERRRQVPGPKAYGTLASATPPRGVAAEATRAS